MHWRASDWEYRAEGGKHIVVYNKENRTILRIIKADNGETVHLVNEKFEIEKRLKYEQYVIGPLLAEWNIELDSGQLVLLPSKFISDLSKLIESCRPQARRNKNIPSGDRYAVLQTDFANNINSQHGPTIAMEIKPKCGFIPSGRTTCLFCLTQLDKIRRGKYDARSGYCPIDLYSSNYHRKLFSLSQLLQNPQNNLRLFVDAKLAYSMETLDQIGSTDCAKQFPEILDKLCANFGGESVSLDRIMNLLCEKLGSVRSLHDQHCQASTFQIGKSVSCPSRGPLGVAAWLQRLSNRSPSAVLESWNSLTPNEKYEIENPSSDWLNSIRKSPEKQTNIDIVRCHLVSATAKDFSLIIAFSDLTDCTIKLVDLDLKPTSKLMEHVQKEALCNKMEKFNKDLAKYSNLVD